MLSFEYAESTCGITNRFLEIKASDNVLEIAYLVVLHRRIAYE